jgi:hypothetical protein
MMRELQAQRKVRCHKVGVEFCGPSIGSGRVCKSVVSQFELFRHWPRPLTRLLPIPILTVFALSPRVRWPVIRVALCGLAKGLMATCTNQNPGPVSPKHGETRTGHPRWPVLSWLLKHDGLNPHWNAVPCDGNRCARGGHVLILGPLRCNCLVGRGAGTARTALRRVPQDQILFA